MGAHFLILTASLLINTLIKSHMMYAFRHLLPANYMEKYFLDDGSAVIDRRIDHVSAEVVFFHLNFLHLPTPF